MDTDWLYSFSGTTEPSESGTIYRSTIYRWHIHILTNPLVGTTVEDMFRQACSDGDFKTVYRLLAHNPQLQDPVLVRHTRSTNANANAHTHISTRWISNRLIGLGVGAMMTIVRGWTAIVSQGVRHDSDAVMAVLAAGRSRDRGLDGTQQTTRRCILATQVGINDDDAEHDLTLTLMHD